MFLRMACSHAACYNRWDRWVWWVNHALVTPLFATLRTETRHHREAITTPKKIIFEQEEGEEGAPRSPERKNLQLGHQRYTTIVRCIPLRITVSFISGEHHLILYRTRYEPNRLAFFTLRSYIVSRTYRNYINYLGIQYSSTWNRMRTRNPHNIL